MSPAIRRTGRLFNSSITASEVDEASIIRLRIFAESFRRYHSGGCHKTLHRVFNVKKRLDRNIGNPGELERQAQASRPLPVLDHADVWLCRSGLFCQGALVDSFTFKVVRQGEIGAFPFHARHLTIQSV